MRYERKSEYGGYLPLELNSGTEMFERYSKYLKDLIRSRHLSIYYRTRKTVKNNDPILLLSVDDRGFKAEWRIFHFIIYPVIYVGKIPDEKENLILLVDYFGVKTEDISRIAKQYEKAAVIIDYAHSFFAEPIFQKNIYNVYSARKFLEYRMDLM